MEYLITMRVQFDGQPQPLYLLNQAVEGFKENMDIRAPQMPFVVTGVECKELPSEISYTNPQ